MAELPSGTVTFLFTDIEGSTTRWEEARVDGASLAHHDELFVFLDRPDGPPTMNVSERDLRPAGTPRKVTGGHRSRRGAEPSATLTSLLATARGRGQNLLGARAACAGA
jgi:hypothetical protein